MPDLPQRSRRRRPSQRFAAYERQRPSAPDFSANELGFQLTKSTINTHTLPASERSGTQPYWNTATASDYADGGAGGVGVFRRDTAWTPYSGALSLEANYVHSVKGDMNADGRSDVIWRGQNNGAVVQWMMAGSGVASVHTLIGGGVNVNFHVAALADFDRDGYADVLWHNVTTGEVVMWKVQNQTVMTVFNLGSVNTAYGVEAVADLNGDGIPDVIWRNPTTGAYVIWIMNGFGVGSVFTGSVDASYKIEAAADLDGDGKADLVFHQQVGDGNVVICLMDGATIRSATLIGGVRPDYHIEAAGDFDGDGKADLMWHGSADGGVVLFMMNGTLVRSVTVLTGSAGTSANAHIEAVGDFDGDGKADVMWRDVTTGVVTQWLMNGTSIGLATNLGSVNTSYKIEGPK